ncbi:MAG TPA: hypothetical protein VI685_13970 [Candidatus Angelobacter sp.]
MIPLPITCMVVALAIFIVCAVVMSMARHRTRKPEPIGYSNIFVFLNWVDIEGLRKLIDPMEEAFLRQSHTRIEFSKIQEGRIQAACEYFRKMVANATALQNFGYRHLGGTDNTKRLLAHRLINFAVPVRMFGRSGIFILRVWKPLSVLQFVLITRSLPDLKDLVEETLQAYQELKEAALALAAYSEPGIEDQLFPRL